MSTKTPTRSVKITAEADNALGQYCKPRGMKKAHVASVAIEEYCKKRGRK